MPCYQALCQDKTANNMLILVEYCRFAVVHPLQDHTKLELEVEGLQLLRNIKGLVAPVVVIGPYRSGKSFTLNQLLGVGCGEPRCQPDTPLLLLHALVFGHWYAGPTRHRMCTV